MNITYRNLAKNDYNDIKCLIRKAWYDEYNFSDSIKNAYASAYFHECMANSNYRTVACDGNKIVGFILGKHRNVNFWERFKHLFILNCIKFGFLFSKPGRRKLKIIKKTNYIDNQLLKPHNHIVNELTLFIVDENYGGNGIGSTLEKGLMQYLKEKNEQYIYLFTDTYSNYKFYERRNYIRCGEIEVDFGIKGEEKDPLPTYFIYYKEI